MHEGRPVSERTSQRAARGLRLPQLPLLPLLTAALFVAASTFTSRASAQEWLKDRMYQEGQGFRTGDLEWHPGIGVEGGYDSNYFLRTNTTGANIANGCPNACPQGTPEMRVTPSLSIATLGAQRREGEVKHEPPSVDFRLNASGTYQEFFGQLQPEQRNFGANANARLNILPERPFGGAVFANYSRVIQPNNINGNPDLSFNRDAVGAGAELSTQPGGGTLDWHLGYQFADTLFEETAGQPYSNFVNQIYTKGRWKFRPRTALLYDGNFSFVHYENANGAVAGNSTAGIISPLYPSDPVRSRIGINGLVTPRFAFLGMVGYGGTFFVPATKDGTPPAQYDSVIGQAEFKFFLTAQPGDSNPMSLTLSSIAIGYNRDFTNSYLSDFYGTDRGYLKFSYFFAGRALVSLEGGAAALEYPTFALLGQGAKQEPSFTDARIDATLYGEYRFTNYFAVNLTGKFTTELSSTEIPLPAAGGAAGDFYAMQWRRIEIYGGLRLFL
jgi:hypothetical protein